MQPFPGFGHREHDAGDQGDLQHRQGGPVEHGSECPREEEATGQGRRQQQTERRDQSEHVDRLRASRDEERGVPTQQIINRLSESEAAQHEDVKGVDDPFVSKPVLHLRPPSSAAFTHAVASAPARQRLNGYHGTCQ